MRASRSARSSCSEFNVSFQIKSVKHKEDRPMTVHLHPSIDSGVKKGSGAFAGGTLVCKCKDKPVKVGIKGDVAHDHVCGCTQCWKPDGATFSVVGVVPKANVQVTQNGDKLKVVNPSALILRHACSGCGVHMYGPVERPKH